MIQSRSNRKKPFKPRIAVYHRSNLMYLGGGEAVCVQTLEALKADYEVTLLTVEEELDFQEINKYFGTGLSSEEINVEFLDPHPIREIRYLLRKIIEILPFETEFLRLKNVLIDWYLARLDDRYDLVVSTLGESAYQGASIDYVHYPSDYVYYYLDEESGSNYGPYMTGNNEIPFYFLYDALVNYLFPYEKYRTRDKTTLVNSNWTGRKIKKAYGVDYKVLYPPVKTGDFNPPPWNEKESGFIALGRIEREKRVLRSMEIIDELSDSYDIHLHLVGEIKDREYGEIVRKKAESSPAISLEGRVSRKRLIELIEGHKFGIHGMPAEHFGIAVAEMVAGGCIPFLPDDGGQVEIVEENPDLLYSDKDEAVEKISRMLDDPQLQKKTLRRLAGRAEEFSAERFRGKMREFVARKLDSKSQIEGKGDCLS